MIQAVLLGNADTKRTEYFRKAAQQVKLSFFFADWNDFEVWKAQLLDGQKRLVKIDPPLCWTAWFAIIYENWMNCQKLPQEVRCIF